MSNDSNGRKVLGPTGQFPNGKIRPDDEGQVRVAVTVENNRIMIRFGASLTWLGLDAATADEMIRVLTERRKELNL